MEQGQLGGIAGRKGVNTNMRFCSLVVYKSFGSDADFGVSQSLLLQYFYIYTI